MSDVIVAVIRRRDDGSFDGTWLGTEEPGQVLTAATAREVAGRLMRLPSIYAFDPWSAPDSVTPRVADPAAPGGYLDPEQVRVLRSALDIMGNIYEAIDRSPHEFDEVLAVFDGVRHGVRVEAVSGSSEAVLSTAEARGRALALEVEGLRSEKTRLESGIRGVRMMAPPAVSEALMRLLRDEPVQGPIS